MSDSALPLDLLAARGRLEFCSRAGVVFLVVAIVFLPEGMKVGHGVRRASVSLICEKATI